MRKLLGTISMLLCVIFTISAFAWTADSADTAGTNNFTEKVEAADDNDDTSFPQEPTTITNSTAPWTDDDLNNIYFYDIDKVTLEALAKKSPENFTIKTVDTVVYTLSEDEVSLLLPGDTQHFLAYEPSALPTVEVGTIVTLYILLAV